MWERQQEAALDTSYVTWQVPAWRNAQGATQAQRMGWGWRLGRDPRGVLDAEGAHPLAEAAGLMELQSLHLKGQAAPLLVPQWPGLTGTTPW